MDLPVGGRRIDVADLDRLWEPWTPSEVSERLAAVTVPWCVAAGWALDLYLGGTPRDHADIEIAVPRKLFREIVAALPGFEWDVAGDGRVWSYAEAGAHPDLHQAWCREPGTGRYRLDVFREPHEENRWICRRDSTITMPYDELIRLTRTGVPYLIPEVVLLFKARGTRPKDHEDFQRVAPHLDSRSGRRLAEWLQRLYPDHPWLPQLMR